MRWIFRLFILLSVVGSIGLIAVVAMCIESSPLVRGEIRLSVANIERAKSLVREHDPRKLRDGEVKTVSMSEEELTLVANHLINRLGSGGAALEMNDGRLTFAMTFDLSKILPGRYVNVETIVSDDAGTPRLEQLTVGRVSFPRPLIGALAAFTVEHLYRASGVKNAREVIQAVHIRTQHLDITYQWQAGIADAIRDRIVSRGDRQKLGAYNSFLASEVERQGAGLSFASLIEAMFRRAHERSEQGQPAAENRAAILVLAAYVNGRGLTALAPEAADWVKPKRAQLRILGRKDFVSHFATSAALAVTGGGAVSNAIGLYKEIDDADGGSGFSFKDLAADMAGTRFGQVAVANDSSASRLQRRIGAGIDDLTLIPDVRGLAENMSDAEFKRRYDGVGGRRYRLVVEDIDKRIANSALYR